MEGYSHPCCGLLWRCLVGYCGKGDDGFYSFLIQLVSRQEVEIYRRPPRDLMAGLRFELEAYPFMVQSSPSEVAIANMFT